MRPFFLYILVVCNEKQQLDAIVQIICPYPHSLFEGANDFTLNFCILVFLEKNRKEIICVYSSVRKESSSTVLSLYCLYLFPYHGILFFGDESNLFLQKKDESILLLPSDLTLIVVDMV